MRDLKFFPILDLLPPEAEGFSIHVKNCQESFELLQSKGYVDFAIYQGMDKKFIRTDGYHVFNKNGVFTFGKVLLQDYDKKNYPCFNLEEFLNICDNVAQDPYSSEVLLSDLLQE